MFQRRPAVSRTGRIVGAAAVAAIASPVRQEIIDTIETLGGSASVGELAEQLARPADGLYYHVEVLRRAGLVVAVPGRRGGRGERRYRIPVAADLWLDYRVARPKSLRRVIATMLRIAGRDFSRALDVPSVTVAGPERELWAGRATGWVSERDLVEINRALAAISARLRKPRGGRRRKLVSLCYVLAPLPSRPKRRGPA
jgi:DNA-binding transcriptional ArsR family regulator